MAIFKKTKKEKETKAVPSAVSSGTTKEPRAHSYAHVLLSPRITEKATALAAHGAYVFDVLPRANKNDVAAAVRETYKVTPVRVAITAIPAKRTFVRGRAGKTGGGKKAIVYVKKGEKIEFA